MSEHLLETFLEPNPSREYYSPDKVLEEVFTVEGSRLMEVAENHLLYGLGSGGQAVVLGCDDYPDWICKAAARVNRKKQDVVVTRLEQEKEIYRRLVGVPGVPQLGEPNEMGMMWLRRINGLPLSECLEQFDDELKIIGLLKEVAWTMWHAHSRGVIHRDLKPSNVMVGKDGSIVTSDFGIALVDGGERITTPGNFCGTPYYVAPDNILERLTEGYDIDYRADIYSLAAIGWELSQGETPIESLIDQVSSTPEKKTQSMHVQAQLIKWSRHKYQLLAAKPMSPGLYDVLSKGLSPDRNNRFQSMEEFYLALDDLERYLLEKKTRIGLPKSNPMLPSVNGDDPLTGTNPNSPRLDLNFL